MEQHLESLRSIVEKPHRLLCIAGPTGCGKSALALQLALKYQGVVINADSRQLYQGLPLLTAQPDAQALGCVPHALYQDFPDLAPGLCAANWMEHARDAIRCCHGEGRLPILVGGTGFYIQSLEYGLSPMPKVTPLSLEEAQVLGQDANLHGQLQRIDPKAAQKIDPRNLQRILRALSVFYRTGQPLSSWHCRPREPLMPELQWFKLYVDVESSALQKRMEQRLDRMYRQGVLEEVQTFGVQENTPLSASIGLQVLRQHLSGALDWDSARKQILTETWQYARRQRTWFRQKFVSDLRLVS